MEAEAAERVREQTIAVSGNFGFVLRRRALEDRKVAFMRVITDVFDGADPVGVSDELISFGPLKGSATAYEVSERMFKLGFEYFDDFFEVAVNVPAWCELRVRHA